MDVVICFQISIFEPLETALSTVSVYMFLLWFAFKLVSLNHWKQQYQRLPWRFDVVICFQISIFEPLETAQFSFWDVGRTLWFAFKLVSLNHWKQQDVFSIPKLHVVICFQISIFEPLETASAFRELTKNMLWFAFKLVSLNHWKQQDVFSIPKLHVVICFQISIFEPLETASAFRELTKNMLWFAFKLVSLNHWKQPLWIIVSRHTVVICFQISIFEPLETAKVCDDAQVNELWFAFKLVSLNHWKQLLLSLFPNMLSCDLLSN